MQKLFSVNQIHKADQETIKSEPISSLDLMERAAGYVTEQLTKKLIKSKKSKISIFCGVGNNGGDGLVITRLLLNKGYSVDVYIVEVSNKYSDDFKANLTKLPVNPTFLTKENHHLESLRTSYIIDCIFGIGLSRPIEGFSKTVVQQINKNNAVKVAVDVPSGLFIDKTSSQNDCIVKANYTYTFQFPKLAFLMPENEKYIGQWQVIDIGLDKVFIGNAKTDHYYVTQTGVSQIIKKRREFAHKGDFGKALILAGSRGKIGAAVLCGKACLRSGVGLLTIQAPSIGEVVLQSTIPEAMVIADENEDYLSSFPPLQNFTVLGAGPGIGKEKTTQSLLKKILKDWSKPMVLDADALNILSEDRELFQLLPQNCILTPHVGEFKRLVGDWKNDFERLELQKEFTKEYKVYLIVKGKYTSITCPDGKVYFNSTGNSGMATGGSGDCLTGIITALLGQKYTSMEACLLGVYIHGLSGDIAAERLGKLSMLPSDLIDCLPIAFRKLEGKEN